MKISTTPPDLSAPAAQLEAIARIAGAWKCIGSTPAGALGPGTPRQDYVANVLIAPRLNGNAWIMDYAREVAAEQGFAFAGSWLVGYDGMDDCITFYWTDNVGSSVVQTSQGWHGDTMVISGRGSVRLPTPEGGFVYRTAEFRDTHVITGPGTKRWKGEMKVEGTTQWVVLGEDTCTRLSVG